MIKEAAVTLCVSSFLLLFATFFPTLLPIIKVASWIVFSLAILIDATEGIQPRDSFWSRYPLWVPRWLKIVDVIVFLFMMTSIILAGIFESPERPAIMPIFRFLLFIAIMASLRSAAYWHAKENGMIPAIVTPDDSLPPETLEARLDAIRDEHFPSLSQKRK